MEQLFDVSCKKTGRVWPLVNTSATIVVRALGVGDGDAAPNTRLAKSARDLRRHT